MRVLVTGGAGFIGSHLTDLLIEENHTVTILDDLSGSNAVVPPYLNPKAKLIIGDVKNKAILDELIPACDAVFHFASKLGLAQSNYEISAFVEDNCLGTGRLLQAIVDSKKRPKLIVAGSNTAYGEGLYFCAKCNRKFHPEIRAIEDVQNHGLEVHCNICSSEAKHIPTPEDTELKGNSIYALTKKFQEESALMMGKMYGFPVTVLRFFNVFGPRQSLSNPYTGVSAIFTTRIKGAKPVVIYEDGAQTRDFIYVRDVAKANMLAMKSDKANYNVINIGSGNPAKIVDLARTLYKILGERENIAITNKYRKGDIRHCVADLTKAKMLLGWEPRVEFEQGIGEMLEWAKNEHPDDKFDIAQQELKNKQLI